MGREIVDGEVVDTNTGEVIESARGGSALAIRQQAAVAGFGGLIRPIASVPELLSAQEETRKVIEDLLQEGRDYGVIPGTKKKSMLQPGAERVNSAYGVFGRHRVIEQEVDHDRVVPWTKQKKVWHNAFKGDKSYDLQEENGTSLGLYTYVVECELVHRASGTVIGQAIASCSSMESKYIDRPRDSQNTILQMAEKRAYIRATRNAHGLSDQFTQDVEDNPERVAREASEQNQQNQHRDGGAAPSGDFLDTVTFSKKFPGQTWRELIAAGGKESGWVKWAIENAENLTPDQKKLLADARANAKAAATFDNTGEQQKEEKADDDQPFTKKQRTEFEAQLKHLSDMGMPQEKLAEHTKWLNQVPAPTVAMLRAAIESAKRLVAKKQAEKSLAEAAPSRAYAAIFDE